MSYIVGSTLQTIPLKAENVRGTGRGYAVSYYADTLFRAHRNDLVVVIAQAAEYV